MCVVCVCVQTLAKHLCICVSTQSAHYPCFSPLQKGASGFFSSRRRRFGRFLLPVGLQWTEVTVNRTVSCALGPLSLTSPPFTASPVSRHNSFIALRSPSFDASLSLRWPLALCSASLPLRPARRWIIFCPPLPLPLPHVSVYQSASPLALSISRSLSGALRALCNERQAGQIVRRHIHLSRLTVGTLELKSMPRPNLSPTPEYKLPFPAPTATP